MYTHGNNAYQLEAPAVRRKKKVSRKKAKKHGMKNLNGMVCILAVFLIAFVICSRYVKIYGLHNEIEQKNRQLAALETENEQTKIAIDSMVEPSKIEACAAEQLGLEKISSSQVVYLQPSQGDSMHKIAKNEEKSATKGLFGIFSGSSEYSK